MILNWNNTMKITRLHKTERMSKVVIHNDTIYLCGQVGSGNNITEQTTTMLEKVDALLAEVDCDKSRILTSTIWLSDMSNFAEMNLVWDAWIDPQNPPARACGEARLATEALLVEIIVTAAKN